MKLAVIGSRGIVVAELEKYIPQNAEEIVSGGARGGYLWRNMRAATESGLPNSCRIMQGSGAERRTSAMRR